MLVKFVIEPEAIDNSTTPAHIRRLLGKWERFGVLVYPARGDAVIRDTLRRLSPAAKKCWMVTLGKVAKSHRNYYRWLTRDARTWEWWNLRTADAMARGVGQFEVALLDESRATILDIPDGESKSFAEVEGIRLWDVDVSRQFARSEEMSTESIRLGAQIEDVWEQRFQRLAAYSKDVVVVDQYALQQGQIGGTLRLLRLLDRDSDQCDVTVYSAGDDVAHIERVVRQQATQLGAGGIRCIQVKLFQGNGFRIYAHDRHVRFDSSVFRIGRGTRVFVQDVVGETTDVALTTLRPGSSEQKENDLDARVRPVHQFCVQVDGTEERA